jgi:hypothetical protein
MPACLSSSAAVAPVMPAPRTATSTVTSRSSGGNSRVSVSVHSAVGFPGGTNDESGPRGAALVSSAVLRSTYVRLRAPVARVERRAVALRADARAVVLRPPPRDFVRLADARTVVLVRPGVRRAEL